MWMQTKHLRHLNVRNRTILGGDNTRQLTKQSVTCKGKGAENQMRSVILISWNKPAVSRRNTLLAVCGSGRGARGSVVG
jgi:hypothetical protein